MHKQCECFLLHGCTLGPSSRPVSDPLPLLTLSSSPTLHHTAGVASSARDGLRLGARSTCARPGCRRRRATYGGHELRGPWRKGATWQANRDIYERRHGVATRKLVRIGTRKLPCFARTHTRLIWFLNVVTNSLLLFSYFSLYVTSDVPGQ